MFLRHIASLGDGKNSLATKLDSMLVDQQKLDDHIQSNTTPPLQSALENSAAENSVPPSPSSLLLDNSQRTSSEEADTLNLRRSTRIHRNPQYLAENYQL